MHDAPSCSRAPLLVAHCSLAHVLARVDAELRSHVIGPRAECLAIRIVVPRMTRNWRYEEVTSPILNCVNHDSPVSVRRKKSLMNCYAQSTPASRGLISAACAAVIAFTFAAALPAHAAKVTPPDVPGNLKVLDGTHAYLVGHAVGTQNYVCSPSATTNAGVAYVLFTPEATLLNDDGDQLITHYFSPNPDQHKNNTKPTNNTNNTKHTTKQQTRDGS